MRSDPSRTALERAVITPMRRGKRRAKPPKLVTPGVAVRRVNDESVIVTVALGEKIVEVQRGNGRRELENAVAGLLAKLGVAGRVPLWAWDLEPILYAADPSSG